MCYSSPSFERPLPLKTTSLERPQFACTDALQYKTTSSQRPPLL